MHTIAGISADKLTLTLEQNLSYGHLGITETFSKNRQLELRAEVGLLTRNIKIRGNIEEKQGNEAPRCDEGFELGKFTVFLFFSVHFSTNEQYKTLQITHILLNSMD